MYIPNPDDTPEDLVRMGLIDPVRLFVKNEPHKLSKIQEDRLRLISSVSLLDNTVCKAFCNFQNKSEIESYATIPQKPGMGLHDIGIQTIYDYVPENMRLLETDFSSWDWQVTEDMLLWDLERRRRLAGVDKSSVWWRVMRSHFHCISRKVFTLSDGRMFIPNIVGILPSGWANTSSTNSAIRRKLSYKSHFPIVPWCMSNGDDCVEEWSDKAVEFYKGCGMRLKTLAEVTKSDFTFCSNHFLGGKAIPENVDKMLYRLLNARDKDQDLVLLYVAFLREIRNCPDRDDLIRLVHNSGLLDGVSLFNDPNLRSEELTERPRDRKDHLVKELQTGVRSDLSLSYPILMTRKNKNRKQVNAQPKQKQKSKSKAKQQPGRLVNYTQGGTAVGSALGAIAGSFIPGFGTAVGAGLGGMLGGGIGRILGSGDYVMSPMTPNSNIFASQVPKFAGSTHGVTITHREYLGDISGSVAFTTTGYILNPANSQTFPWLSTIAENFEQYRMKGLIFEFRTMSSEYNTSTAALGSVVLATEYNSAAPAFTSKQQMENYDFAVSAKPSCNMAHAIECKSSETTIPHLYVGTAPTGFDSRFYNLGVTYLATAGMSSAYTIGELWVSYSIEFYKPRIPATIGGNVNTFIARRSVATAATNPIGSTQVSLASTGSLNPTFSGTTVSFTAAPTSDYLFQYAISGAAVTWTAPIVTITGATGQNVYNNKTSSTFTLPANGTASATNGQYSAIVSNTSAVSSSTITFTFGLAGTIPTATNYVEIIVTQLDDSIFPIS